jgi:hypothetical protein
MFILKIIHYIVWDKMNKKPNNSLNLRPGRNEGFNAEMV